MPLSFTVIRPSPLVQEEYFNCSLDGQAISKQSFTVIKGDERTYSATLKGLSDGLHTLTITIVGSSSYDKDPGPKTIGEVATVTDYALVTFLVDSASPIVDILSPKSQNYASADIALNFILSESVDYVEYSLDGKDNVTITGNTTLTSLSNGTHNVIVYAKDEAGNVGASETVTFTVANESGSFLPAVVAGVSGVSVAVVGVGLFWYFRKRNR